MLKIHFLNVGHGDCAVIEYTAHDGIKSFGIVDSNKKGNEAAPALRTLRALGATRLAFVVLTHPHADHFKGLNDVIDEFGDNIDHIFTFPIDRERQRLLKFAKAYQDAVANSENEESVDLVTDLLNLLAKFVELNEKGDRWETPTGDGAFLRVAAMPDVEITTVLPHAGVKGPFFNAIDEGKTVMKADRQNHLSLAIRIRYGGQQIILGGDGTYDNWVYVRSRTPDGLSPRFGSAKADIAKLPHHGSAHDCAPIVLDYIYGSPEHTRNSEFRRVAIISGNGSHHHPARDVLLELQQRGIDPYCTSLSRHCSPAVAAPSVASNTVDPALVRFISGQAKPAMRLAHCQGDIVLSIDPQGQTQITPQFASPCGMRGTLPF